MAGRSGGLRDKPARASPAVANLDLRRAAEVSIWRGVVVAFL
jgi:hypothetical protein